jgi:hypothetical protein
VDSPAAAAYAPSCTTTAPLASNQWELAKIGGAAGARQVRGRDVREPPDRHMAGIRESEGILLLR